MPRSGKSRAFHRRAKNPVKVCHKSGKTLAFHRHTKHPLNVYNKSAKSSAFHRQTKMSGSSLSQEWRKQCFPQTDTKIRWRHRTRVAKAVLSADRPKYPVEVCHKSGESSAFHRQTKISGRSLSQEWRKQCFPQTDQNIR